MAEEEMARLPKTDNAFAGARALLVYDVRIEIGKCKHEC